MAHYHIRWSSKEVLDWEAFDSRAEAEASAKQLVRFGETYTIEEHDESCPRCWKAFQLKRSDPNGAHLWQQAVLDALNEANAQQRIKKVHVAQLAISARLPHLTPMDPDEQAAIWDALRALRSLPPKREDMTESNDKRDIA